MRTPPAIPFQLMPKLVRSTCPVAATPIRALATEAALVGQPWNEETVSAASEILRGEGTPMDDHRASAGYRAATLGRSLLKLHADSLEGARA
jgi:xanthine dehydrogenase small subunit